VTISRISWIGGCGVFREFDWPKDLYDFGRYNVIYGWNGSGKTTLSRIFRALEMRTAPSGEAIFWINGYEVNGDVFAGQTLPVRVFNRDFVSESVFPVDGGSVPPIFVVGKENVERQKELEGLKVSFLGASKELEQVRQDKRGPNRELDSFCIARAKSIKDMLRSSGANSYNNYDKTSFQARADKMAAERDAATHELSDADRIKFIAQHTATLKPHLQFVTYQFPSLEAIAEGVSRELSKTVVAGAIPALKEDHVLSIWLREALHLHHDRQAEQCLFCERPLPKDRLALLEAHFSAEYEQLVRQLDSRITQLESLATDSVVLPNRAEFYEDLANEYDIARSSIQKQIDSIRTFLDSTSKALNAKKHRMFDRMSLDEAIPEVEVAAIDLLNAIIGQHNEASEAFQSRASDARRRLEADLVASDLEEFLLRKEAIRAADELEGRLDNEAKRLSEAIEQLQSDIVEHRRPAEELNEELHKYFGHSELRLEINGTGYAIMRNGLPAHALSDGETTAIALLYFLKSLKDRRFDLPNGVIVLDDPVSSLDATARYLAFGLIREHCQGAKQLFLLTHNFSFFREVRYWFHKLRRHDKNEGRFYMVECSIADGPRSSKIVALPSLLREYQSEYHYLFANILRAANAPVPVPLEENYILANMARRVLETFLAFRQPTSIPLWDKLQEVKTDYSKKVRILRFVDSHSHGNVIEEGEHDCFVLGEVRPVLCDLLEVIRAEDPAHYDGMCSVIRGDGAGPSAI
jgi:wobble nucleotide-excising tRNase